MPLSPSDESRLEHMRQAAADALNFLTGLTRESFLNSDLHVSAVERKLVTIGEAASYVSRGLTVKYPKVQWGLITGMRHKLVHDYWNIERGRVWLAAESDLPVLLQDIDLIAAAEA